MVELYTLSKICDMNFHRQSKIIGQQDGIEVCYCPDCEGLRLTRKYWQAPHVSSLRQVAEAFRMIVPKAGSSYYDIGTLPLQEDIIRFCKNNFGMSSDSVRKSIDWLVRAGKDFTLSVNGVPFCIHLGLRRWGGIHRAFVRLPDVSGDPPVAYPIYRCPYCGRSYDLEDLVVDDVFSCSCGVFFRYGEKTVEPIIMLKISEAFDFRGNYLRLYLRNMGSRSAKYSMSVFLNGGLVGLFADDSWSLAPGQDKVWTVRNPPGFGRSWNDGDVLQIRIDDREIGEVLGWSESLIWSEHPWTPLVFTAGIVAAGIALALVCRCKSE